MDNANIHLFLSKNNYNLNLLILWQKGLGLNTFVHSHPPYCNIDQYILVNKELKEYQNIIQSFSYNRKYSHGGWQIPCYHYGLLSASR